MKTKLTTRALDALGRDYKGELLDSASPGLRVRVSPSGAVTFSFFYTFGGKRYRLVLGRYPALGLADARAASDALRAALQRGLDPRAVVTRDASGALAVSSVVPNVETSEGVVSVVDVPSGNALTFGRLCDLYLEEQAPVLRRSTYTSYRRKIENCLKPKYGTRRTVSMTVDELRAWEQELAKTAPVQANRIHSLMARLFNWATKEKGLIEWNPYSAIGKPAPGAEKAGERVLEDGEIVEIFKALRHERPVIAGLWEVLFWTGLREGTAASAAKENVRLKEGDWIFPVTKRGRGNPEGTGRPFVLPITEPLAELLKFLHKVSPTSAYVFPGNSPRHANADVDRPITALGKAVERMRKATGIKFQMRDIRRTVGTGMARLHVSPQDIARVLDHTVPGEPHVTHAHYLRYTFRKEKLDALNVWTRHVMALVGRYRRLSGAATIEVPTQVSVG